LSKRLKEIFKIVLFLCLGIGVVLIFWAQLCREEKEQFWSSLGKANYWWIGLTILLGTLSHLSRAIRWRLIIEPFGYKPRRANLFFAVMNMYFANMAVPRLGEITRCAILQKYEKIPFEKTFGTVVAERAIDLLILLSLFAVVAWFSISNVESILTSYSNSGSACRNPAAEDPGFLMKNFKLIIAGLAALAGLALYLYRRHPVAGKIYRKLASILLGFWEGLKSVVRVKRPAHFLFHTFFIWTMYFLMTYVCFFCLPETASLSPFTALVTLVFGSVAIVVVPGGIGVFPVVVSAILQIDAFGGIDPGTGLALGWITWSAQTILVLLLGVVSMILLPIFNPEK
jgi:glycosyltransferase 2 family protein